MVRGSVVLEKVFTNQTFPKISSYETDFVKVLVKVPRIMNKSYQVTVDKHSIQINIIIMKRSYASTAGSTPPNFEM